MLAFVDVLIIDMSTRPGMLRCSQPRKPLQAVLPHVCRRSCMRSRLWSRSKSVRIYIAMLISRVRGYILVPHVMLNHVITFTWAQMGRMSLSTWHLKVWRALAKQEHLYIRRVPGVRNTQKVKVTFTQKHFMKMISFFEW